MEASTGLAKRSLNNLLSEMIKKERDAAHTIKLQAAVKLIGIAVHEKERRVEEMRNKAKGKAKKKKKKDKAAGAFCESSLSQASSPACASR